MKEWYINYLLFFVFKLYKNQKRIEIFYDYDIIYLVLKYNYAKIFRFKSKFLDLKIF